MNEFAIQQKDVGFHLKSILNLLLKLFPKNNQITWFASLWQKEKEKKGAENITKSTINNNKIWIKDL